MAENQNPVLNLNEMINEIMNEYAHEEKEVHLEPQLETIENAEPKAQLEVEEPAEEKRTTRRQGALNPTEGIETEGDKDFISAEAQALWNKQMADKGFVSERGLGNRFPLLQK